MNKVNKKLAVIFCQDVIWGKKYETKSLSLGFVWNYLLPNKIVLISNNHNLKIIERQKYKEEKEKVEKEKKAQEIYEKIEGIKFHFSLKKDKNNGVFGSISSKEILEELGKINFDLKKEQLVDFAPLNKIGEHEVILKINKNFSAKIIVIIS